MDLITSLAVVIGVMGGIATAVWLKIALGGSVMWFIWITFVAWASFYAAGGDNDATLKSIAANIWGALIAMISLLIYTKTSGSAVMAGLCVGVAIVVLIMGAKIPALGFIPGQVFGYAPMAGLFVQDFYLGDNALFAGSFPKMFLACVISLVIGNILGIISAKIGGALAKS